MTPELLASAVGCSLDTAKVWADPLSTAMATYEIVTRVSVCAFLAQIGHETMSFRYIVELGNQAYFAKYDGRADLGNTQPGDGYRYRGRGLIQITGRTNYAACGAALNEPLEDNPEWLEQPQLAACSAGWFWQTHGLNGLADQQLFSAITRRINGGLNGQADRVQRYQHALSVVTE